ncbi:MAG: UDP-N-acetylglucosamine 2-epimerase [Syntrophaceae bacterium]
MPERKICVVTGSRAEYGLLFWIIKEIHEDPDLELQIVVTGAHLSPEYGLTYHRIEEDGFKINARVEMLLSSDTPVGVAKSIGVGTIGFADAFSSLCPDIVLLLGDRFEILAAAQAAMIARLPIAHIHGGEATEGLIDEAIRHAVTKMSHIHFVAAEPYRQRVIQLGESPGRVMNFGAPGLDNLTKMKLLDRDSFEEALDFKLGFPTFMVTYHPVTLSHAGAEKPMRELLAALDCFPEAKIIFTKANSDPDGRIINRMIDDYVVSGQRGRAKAFTSMGQLLYLSALKHVDVVVGNSSSGIIEVPSMKKPTVNIGERQRGRLKASSVIDCPEEKEAIKTAVGKALSSDFQRHLKDTVSPYGKGNASAMIKNYLKTVDLQGILMKRFHDLFGGQ